MVSRALKCILFPILVFAMLVLPVLALAQDGAPVAVDPSVFVDAITAIATGFTSFGWLGALAAFLAVVVRVYRSIPGAPWNKLPKWAQLLIVFAITGAGGGLTAFLGGGGAVAAIAAGLAAGLAAIGMHQVGKTALEAAKGNPPLLR